MQEPDRERQKGSKREGDSKECIVLTYFHIFVCVCLYVCLWVRHSLIFAFALLLSSTIAIPPSLFLSPPPSVVTRIFLSLLTRIRCINMKFTKIFRSLRKVVRVRIGEQYIHIQFEASIGYALLQRRREGAGVKSHKHFRSAVKNENENT